MQPRRREDTKNARRRTINHCTAGCSTGVPDSRVLGGKPCVRGTRPSVEFLLELAASGATREEILVQYPQRTGDGVAAAFRYAADVLKGEETWELKITA